MPPAIAPAERPSLDAGERPPSPNDQLRDEWANFLGRWPWRFFVTLTFRQAVHPETADKRFRVLVAAVNRGLYGARWYGQGRGARWVRALELQRREVIHYHVLLGGQRIETLRYRDYHELWERVAGYSWWETPRSEEAVRRYCGKYVVKGGDVDVGGPGMHERPASCWPRDWVNSRTLRQLDRARHVTDPAAWQELERCARAGLPLSADVVARIRARLGAQLPLDVS